MSCTCKESCPKHGDTAFWDQVLRRWNASNEEVSQLTAQAKRKNTEITQLTNELKQVQDERDKFRRVLEEARKEKESLAANRTLTTTTERQHYDLPGDSRGEQEDGRVNVLKLHELEEGISEAQESYRKIEKQLQDNESMIQDLLRGNQALRSDRNVMELQRNESEEALKVSESKLKHAIAEADLLRERIRAWVKERVSPAERTQPLTLTERTLRREIEGVYQPRIANLERELADLRNLNRNLENEAKVLREEVHATQTKLNKFKQSKHSLQDQLKGLGEITRGRRESLRSYESSIRTTTGSQAGGAASLRSINSSILPPAISRPSKSHLKAPSTNTVDRKMVVGFTQPENRAVAEDNAPTPRPGFVQMGIPLLRQMEINKFPVISAGMSIDSTENIFSRDFMTDALGGSTQPLIVRVAKQSHLSKKNGLKGYLCPGLDHNPWCPSTPGQHGYIFVGLGREKSTFLEPEEHNVFVGLKRTSKDLRRFKYLGKYRAIRVQALTHDEWLSLADHVRRAYAKTTKEKTKDVRSIEEIIKAYDDGVLRVPCVQLQCIDFDQELYKALVAENAKAKSKDKSSSSSSNKRALDYEADGDDYARKRRTVLRRPS